MMLGIMQGPLTWAFAENHTYKLTDKVTDFKVQFQRKNGDHYETTDTVKDGDDIQITLDYTIPKDTLSSVRDQFTYQLPGGIALSKELKGFIFDSSGSGPSVGQFTIDTNGLVTISYNSNFDVNLDHTEKFRFQTKFDKNAMSDQGQSGKLVFGGSSMTIKLETDQGNTGGDHSGGSGTNPGGNTTPSVNHDLQIKKTSQQSPDKTKIEYTVIASSDHGSGAVVSLYDAFQNVSNADPKYERNSFHLVKKTGVNDAGQPVTINQNNLVFGQNGNLEKFDLTNLPALNAGESYVLTYTADVNAKSNSNGEVKVGNGITAKKGNDWGGNGYNSAQISKSMVDKNGYYDKGEIRWEVIINEDQRDLNDYTFDDNLPYKLTRPYQVYCGNDRWNTNEEMSSLEKGKAGDTNIHIAFKELDDNHKKKVFKVVYYTQAPEVTTSEGKKVVKNIAELTSGGGNGYSSNKDVDVYPYTFSVQKAASEQKMNGDHASYTWTPTMNLSGNKATSFIYKDIIEDPTYEGKNDTDDTSDYHYAHIKDLKEAISKSLTVKHKDDHGNEVDYDRNAYTWTLKCYDAKNNEINENDNDAKVKSFTLEVIANNAEDFRPTSASIVYQTIGDLSRVMPGQKWDFKNSGLMTNYNGHDIDEGHTRKGDSHFEYENKKALTKLASATGDPGSYTNGVLDVYKTKPDNATDENKYLTEDTIHYRILLNVNKDQKGPLTVTDTLPKGMRYKEGTMKVQFYNGDNDLKPTNYKWIQSESRHFSFENEETKPTLKQSENSDKQAVLTFTIPGGFENDHDQKIAIDYEGVVTDDPDWKDMTVEKKSFTNNAKCDNHEDSQTTNVKRPVETVHKKGTQLKDQAGQYTNTIEYSVEINPAGKKLNPKGDSITFSDVLTAEDGVKAYLDLQNVKLYKFDVNADNHRSQTMIDASSYSLRYDEKTHTISGELPDATPCVLVYRYSIDKGNKDQPAISNKAELAGKYSSFDNSQVKKNSADVIDTAHKLTIRKVDADNYAKGLPGAEFSVEEYSNGWITPEAYKKNSVTNSYGETVLTTYAAGKLYRIRETKAPANYLGDSNYYYFMITDDSDNSTAQTAFDKDYENLHLPDNMKNPNDKDNYVNKDKIHFFGQNGGKIIVPNEYTKLTVNKTWLNADGSKADQPGANSVDLKLYRYIKKSDGIKVTLIMKNNYENKTGVFTVDRNSAFTVKWGQYDTSGIQSVLVNGKEMSVTDDHKFTSPSLTSDATIQITSKDWFHDPTYEFKNPQTAIDESSKTEISSFTLQGNTQKAEENWSKTFNNLPTKDGNNEYVYAVEETTQLNGYETKYYGNKVKSGTIAVANRKKPDTPKTPETVLPSTGGKGTTMFYAAGLLLISLASFLFIRRYKHLNERG